MILMKIGRGGRGSRPPLHSGDSRLASADAWIDEAARLLVTSEPSPEAQRALIGTVGELRNAVRGRSVEPRGISWLTIAATSIAVLLLAIVEIRVIVQLASPAEARLGEALLLQLSESQLSFWINESLLGYPSFLFLHTLGLALVVGLGVAVDLRLLGVGVRVPLATLRPVIPAIWIGFLMSTLSGVFLFSADAPAKGHHPVFAIKLALVGCAILVTGVIERHLAQAEDNPSPAGLRTLAIASLLLWTAAVIAGRLVGYLAEGALI